MVCCSMFGCESYLALAQDIMFSEEVLQSAVQDAAEQLPQVAADTDASVIIWVKFVSTLKDWCDDSFTPEVREMSDTQNKVK